MPIQVPFFGRGDRPAQKVADALRDAAPAPSPVPATPMDPAVTSPSESAAGEQRESAETVVVASPVVERTKDAGPSLVQEIAASSTRSQSSADLERILLSRGANPMHVRYAMQRHEATGETLSLIMRDFGLVSGEQVAQAQSELSGYDYFGSRDIERIDASALRSIRLDRFDGYVPVGFDQNRLIVAVSDVSIASEARNTWHKYTPRIVIASETTVQAVYRKHFARTEQEFDEALAAFVSAFRKKALEDNPDLSPNLLGSLLRHACYSGASDIYLWKTAYVGLIKLKINGVGYLFRSIDKEVFDLLLNKIVMENGNAAQLRLEPQETTVDLKGDAVRKRFEDVISRYGFRLELIETRGEREAVIRVLDRQSAEADFNRLGFDTHTAGILRRWMQASTGLVIVTGPTGSGKTTSLYAMLKQIDPVERSIQTIENPIEYRYGLWMQHEVHREHKEAEGMKILLNALLRNAPDVILFGEVRRSLEVANTLIDASNTGHLVFTTLHTNSAPDAITRLKSLGVEMESLASVLHGVLAQRLVRLLCDDCKTADQRDESKDELNASWMNGLPKSIYRPVGCPACNFTGYRGRQMIFEVLEAAPVRSLIEQGAPSSKIAAQGLKPGHSMWACGLKLVASGKTSIDEVRRVALRDGW